MHAPGVTLAGTARIDGAPLFRDVSLDLVGGGWTCLLGASGCGKSTALRLIAGLDTGVTFDGRIAADDAVPLADRVAYMAQEDLLLPWLDVRGNIALGARLRGARVDTARAEALVDRLRLSAHAGKRPAQLSGGQRQRVALARTLMEDRPIVLLDEPFSALDARTRAEMQELSAETLAGRTVLLVTHDPAEAARMGDLVYLMEEGGLHRVPPPVSPAIRDSAAPETMQYGAELMARLRAA
ncbi:MAG: ABC transporter ATP-binding protein [Pseudomonadota bacterium]